MQEAGRSTGRTFLTPTPPPKPPNKLFFYLTATRRQAAERRRFGAVDTAKAEKVEACLLSSLHSPSPTKHLTLNTTSKY